MAWVHGSAAGVPLGGDETGLRRRGCLTFWIDDAALMVRLVSRTSETNGGALVEDSM